MHGNASWVSSSDGLLERHISTDAAQRESWVHRGQLSNKRIGTAIPESPSIVSQLGNMPGGTQEASVGEDVVITVQHDASLILTMDAAVPNPFGDADPVLAHLAEKDLAEAGVVITPESSELTGEKRRACRREDFVCLIALAGRVATQPGQATETIQRLKLRLREIARDQRVPFSLVLWQNATIRKRSPIARTTSEPTVPSGFLTFTASPDQVVFPVIPYILAKATPSLDLKDQSICLVWADRHIW
ncbi:hypothetical protein F5Y18DRAFT_423345 [Xylariaceae sp. FL1019]|nr:hypothetical protein F5Y18DRAFT_423345 [Xylariaceae sp. FL1019]